MALPSDEFLESPIFAFYEFLSPLTFHGLCLFTLGIKDTELKLGWHLTLVTTHQEQMKTQIVFRFFIQTIWVQSQAPLQLVTSSRREGRALQNLAHLFAAKAEVTDGPHVVELDNFHLSVTPVFSDGA